MVDSTLTTLQSGIHVSRHISSHGFALNCNTELQWFDQFVPCGIAGKGTTSLTKECARQIGTGEVAEKLVGAFAKAYQREMVDLREVDPERSAWIDELASDLTSR